MAPTFFVAGALHMSGEKGVLQLLKNAGYTVEPVKLKNLRRRRESISTSSAQ